MQPTIKNIYSQQILDSRGNPTIETTVELSDGSLGRACVPSGASTGDKEALELRDGARQWCGKGVYTAITNIEKKIKPILLGKTPFNIQKIDTKMCNLDGSNNKSHLGANAILSVSLANLKACACSQKLPLYQYINKNMNKHYNNTNMSMPIPMMNILNGGSHADNSVDIQEFMIMPTGFDSYSGALQAGVEIFHSLKNILKKQNYSTTIGDEGGFAPSLKSNKEAIELILEAINQSNYKAGKEIQIALDVAASELYDTNNNTYFLASENKKLSPLQLIEYYESLYQQYPIISIEDGLDQNDWESWNLLSQRLGQKIQIVGDDLTVTNPLLLDQAIQQNSMNAILIKFNQIGTVTETLDAITLAQSHNLGVIISHRSGETEDTTIADLAVGVNAGQIKTGSLCRTDRTAKYNQLLRIENELSTKACYATKKYLGCIRKEKK